MQVGTAEILSLIVALLVPPAIGIFINLVVLSRVAKLLSVRQNRKAEQTVAYGLRLPVFILSWIIGIYFASHVLRTWSLDFLAGTNWDAVELWLKALGTLTVFFILYRLLSFGVKIATSHADASSAILIRKLLAAVFAAIAFLTVLNQFDIDIGPVLASLGVAGLAVALALQDTLSNYFAGIILTVDKPIRPGDFIRMEDGLEGFVDMIGWRTTRIKPFGENTVVVPNNKLANSVVVNNYYPDLAVRVYVDCGVAYESDLQQVEDVCIEVGKEVESRVGGADPNFQPVVRFKEFGDSNINFQVILRALSFTDSFLIKHEYIKALHARFKELGININYPVMQIVDITPRPPQAHPLKLAHERSGVDSTDLSDSSDRSES